MVWYSKKPIAPKPGLSKNRSEKLPSHAIQHIKDSKEAVPYRDRFYTPFESLSDPKEEDSVRGKSRIFRELSSDMMEEDEAEEDSKIGKRSEIQGKNKPSIDLTEGDKVQQKSYEVNVGSEQVKGVMEAVWVSIRTLFK